MTLREIIDAVLEEVGYSSAGASNDVRARLRRRVNEHHRRLLSTPTLTRLLRESYALSFTTVAGTASYGLPPSIGRINGIWESSNDIKLEQRSLTWLRETDPGLTGAGTPEAYIPLGLSPVQQQPTTTSTVVAVSSQDDTEPVLMLEYVSSSGQVTHVQATLEGTIPVTVATDVMEILSTAVSPVAQGTVSLSIDGTTIAAISPGTATARYLRLQLWPTPQDAITYSVDATRDTTELVDDNEEPLLPRDFHYLLVLGTVADEMRMRDDTRYETLRLDMEQGKRDLNNWLWNNADYYPSGGSKSGKMSRLGAWFPAGS